MACCEDAAVRVLLDTCVISELRRPDGDRRVREAVEGLFLSVLSIGEIAKGIGLLEVVELRIALEADEFVSEIFCGWHLLRPPSCGRRCL